MEVRRRFDGSSNGTGYLTERLNHRQGTVDIVLLADGDSVIPAVYSKRPRVAHDRRSAKGDRGRIQQRLSDCCTSACVDRRDFQGRVEIVPVPVYNDKNVTVRCRGEVVGCISIYIRCQGTGDSLQRIDQRRRSANIICTADNHAV